MTTDKPQLLVPKLRFPEFKEKAAWSESPLTDIVRSISSGLNISQTFGNDGFRVTRIETIADGTVDTNKVGRVKTDQDISSYRLKIGDILISNINSISHIGKSVLIDRDYDLYHGMNLLRIEALYNVISSRFLQYWLSSAAARASIRSRANKAVNQASINQTELGKTVVQLPLLAEQRKIADCLGSLDDLIAAESRKLEALRQHKQGLMQQLFPQPGEIMPKLRFPEFDNLPGWNPIQLKDILDYEQPSKYIVGDTSYQNTGTPVLTANKSFVLGHTYETDGIYQRVPVIIFDDFTTNAKYVDFPFKVKSSAIKILKSRGDDELRLVYELMSRIRFDPTQHKRYFISQYQHLKIPLPGKSEQQKIADCLGSLDDLIAAEGQKLKALRQHKQGLMQQLFPYLETK